MRATTLDDFEHYVLDLQSHIVADAEAIDGSDRRFCEDRWERETGSGFGITRVLEGGALLEKAAVNVAIVRGRLSPQRAEAMSGRGRDIDPAGHQPYSAAALTLVFHSAHPFVPTLRADVRRFAVEGQLWYGGGADLTPSYLFERDARDFHLHWKGLCDAYASTLYPEFKAWCDRYFYLPFRREHRGIGGIFFDDLDPVGADYDVERFVRDVGQNVLPSWKPIAARRRALSFTETERRWQLERRGRYLEFNLLYDRGVRFGLEGGRVESIMVSAPPVATWGYDLHPEAKSPEATLLAVLKAPRDWT